MYRWKQESDTEYIVSLPAPGAPRARSCPCCASLLVLSQYLSHLSHLSTFPTFPHSSEHILVGLYKRFGEQICRLSLTVLARDSLRMEEPDTMDLSSDLGWGWATGQGGDYLVFYP